MKLFRNRPRPESDAERDFRTILDIVKDYDKQGFNKLVDALEEAWKAYDLILRTQTRQEKEDADIIEAEKALEKEGK